MSPPDVEQTRGRWLTNAAFQRDFFSTRSGVSRIRSPAGAARAGGAALVSRRPDPGPPRARPRVRRHRIPRLRAAGRALSDPHRRHRGSSRWTSCTACWPRCASSRPARAATATPNVGNDSTFLAPPPLAPVSPASSRFVGESTRAPRRAADKARGSSSDRTPAPQSRTPAGVGAPRASASGRVGRRLPVSRAAMASERWPLSSATVGRGAHGRPTEVGAAAAREQPSAPAAPGDRGAAPWSRRSRAG